MDGAVNAADGSYQSRCSVTRSPDVETKQKYVRHNDDREIQPIPGIS